MVSVGNTIRRVFQFFDRALVYDAPELENGGFYGQAPIEPSEAAWSLDWTRRRGVNR